MMRTLRDWSKGDDVRNNEHHQQVVSALRDLSGSRPADDGGQPGDADGRNMHPGEAWPALIVATGPAGTEPDYADERYWVKKQYIKEATGPAERLEFNPRVEEGDPADEGEDGPPVETIVTATNLAEWPAGSHLLPRDGAVAVWVSSYFDAGDPQYKRYEFTFCPPPFPCIVTGHTRDGTNWRWTYTLAPAEKSAAGYGSWTAIAGDLDDVAYNRYEEINGTSGLTGTGVNVDNLPAGFELQPVPDGVCVLVTVVPRSDDPAEFEYWFSAANGVDGVCTIGGA